MPSSDGKYLRALTKRRDEEGRREDAAFLLLMALYFDLLDRTDRTGV